MSKCYFIKDKECPVPDDKRDSNMCLACTTTLEVEVRTKQIELGLISNDILIKSNDLNEKAIDLQKKLLFLEIVDEGKKDSKNKEADRMYG